MTARIKDNATRTTMLLDAETKRKLVALAEAHDRSLAWIVRVLITKAYKKQFES